MAPPSNGCPGWAGCDHTVTGGQLTGERHGPRSPWSVSTTAGETADLISYICAPTRDRPCLPGGGLGPGRCGPAARGQALGGRPRCRRGTPVDRRWLVGRRGTDLDHRVERTTRGEPHPGSRTAPT